MRKVLSHTLRPPPLQKEKLTSSMCFHCVADNVLQPQVQLELPCDVDIEAGGATILRHDVPSNGILCVDDALLSEERAHVTNPVPSHRRPLLEVCLYFRPLPNLELD